MKSSSMDGPAAGVGGGAGAATVTRTLASADPPGPLAVIVYVDESLGVTFVEPSGATGPTSGEIVSCVAFVDDQLKVVASPLFREVGFACSVTVGRAGAGAGAGGAVVATGFLLQPATNSPAAHAVMRATRNK